MTMYVHSSSQERPPKPTETATVFGRREDDGDGVGEDESVVEEVSISEEIEEDFVDSSDNRDGGGSTEEQVTKDETVSAAEASMAADYKEQF